MNSIILSNKDDQRLFLFKLIRKNNENWLITIGNWEEIEGRKCFEMTEDIVLDKKGLRDLFYEFKRVVDSKPTEEEVLNISFIKNEPQFKIKCVYKYPDSFNVSPYTVNKYEISAGFNSNYSANKDNREELKYLYANGGMHTFLIYDFTKEELEEFLKNTKKVIDLF